MALDFPFELFLQAQQQKNRNRQDLNQNIQGLGQTFGGLGQNYADLQKQTNWMKTINNLMVDPTVPEPQKNMLKTIAPFLNQSTAGQLLPEVFKSQQKPEYAPVPGMISESGQPLVIDKFTGKITPSEISAKVKPNSFVAMADVRRSQNIMTDLPSRSNPSTAAGAAYQVKVAARQGKAIIGKPGSPQQLALAASDLARAVQRSAPQLETLQGAGFSNNILTQLNRLTQSLTADPSGKDVPKIRRQIYDLLDDLDKTATPWIENQLKNTEDIWEGNLPKNWDMLKKRELGLNIPDVPFQELGNKPLSSGGGSGWSYVGPAQ